MKIIGLIFAVILIFMLTLYGWMKKETLLRGATSPNQESACLYVRHDTLFTVAADLVIRRRDGSILMRKEIDRYQDAIGDIELTFPALTYSNGAFCLFVSRGTNDSVIEFPLTKAKLDSGDN